MNQSVSIKQWIGRIGFGLIFVLAVPLVAVLFVAIFIADEIKRIILYLAVWCSWCARGRYALVVYSDSPVWHDYFTERILPRLEDRAVVVNWSQRKRWQPSLEAFVFNSFGGTKESNPLILVFRPFRAVKEYRFYEPFLEYKHGKPKAVEKMEAAVFELLDRDDGNRSQ